MDCYGKSIFLITNTILVAVFSSVRIIGVGICIISKPISISILCFICTTREFVSIVSDKNGNYDDNNNIGCCCYCCCCGSSSNGSFLLGTTRMKMVIMMTTMTMLDTADDGAAGGSSNGSF